MNAAIYAHLHAGDDITAQEVQGATCINIGDALQLFVNRLSAAEALTLARELRAAALRHGAKEDA